MSHYSKNVLSFSSSIFIDDIQTHFILSDSWLSISLLYYFCFVTEQKNKKQCFYYIAVSWDSSDGSSKSNVSLNRSNFPLKAPTTLGSGVNCFYILWKFIGQIRLDFLLGFTVEYLSVKSRRLVFWKFITCSNWNGDTWNILIDFVVDSKGFLLNGGAWFSCHAFLWKLLGNGGAWYFVFSIQSFIVVRRGLNYINEDY